MTKPSHLFPKVPRLVAGPARTTKPFARTLSRRFRTVSCTTLPPHGHADAAYVIAAVKGPQRNCVFAAAGQGQVQRISLMRTIGNTIVREDFVPSAAIDAHVRAFDATGPVLDVK